MRLRSTINTCTTVSRISFRIHTTITLKCDTHRTNRTKRKNKSKKNVFRFDHKRRFWFDTKLTYGCMVAYIHSTEHSTATFHLFLICTREPRTKLQTDYNNKNNGEKNQRPRKKNVATAAIAKQQKNSNHTHLSYSVRISVCVYMHINIHLTTKI